MTLIPDARASGPTSVESLVGCIRVAGTKACQNIALSARRSPDDVQRQIGPAIRWLIARIEAGQGERVMSRPPIVPYQCIERLRSHLIAELASRESTDPSYATQVVGVMALLEQLADAWKQTDRGKFMACLTGSESASALVAIAHDIRTPLSSILILVDSLRRGRAAASKAIQERQLGLIYGAAHALATLASDLIDAARGEELLAGPARPFSLRETLHSVEAIVRPIAEEKGLELTIDPAGMDARIGHAAPLHRVLLNLATNALRYTDAGSVTVGCRELTATRVEFWVQDTGHGLPESVQKTLFDAFRPEQTLLRFSSSGLGLATVRALLAVMHASLQISTSPEQGTRLSFDLVLPPSPRS